MVRPCVGGQRTFAEGALIIFKGTHSELIILWVKTTRLNTS